LKLLVVSHAMRDKLVEYGMTASMSRSPPMQWRAWTRSLQARQRTEPSSRSEGAITLRASASCVRSPSNR